jgi:hypothetical protein
LVVEEAMPSISVSDHLGARQLLLQALDDHDALLTPAEFSLLRRCSKPQTYALLDRGLLQGPPGRPRRIFAWSAKAFLKGEPAGHGGTGA